MSEVDEASLVGVNPKLQSFIRTRDRKLQDGSYISPVLSEAFATLLSEGSVKVGGRASCGGKVDPTWVMYGFWNDIVRKARRLGYDITQERMTVKNGYASNNGGFWDESVYTLKKQA